MSKANILITSVGRRTKLIEYFKKDFKGSGNVVVTDCSNLAPALYLGDKSYIVPRIDDPSYIDSLLDICKKEDIKGILSLIDPELSLIAKNADRFLEVGTTPIISSFDECELWFDKYESFKFLEENGFKCAKSYIDFDEFKDAIDSNEVDFPVFIKPNRGSASLDINIAKTIEEAKFIFDSSDDMIIQEFIKGQELGVDVYKDMISKEIVSIFIKEKIVMRSGETDKAKSIKSDKLFSIVKDLFYKSNLMGPIDMDIFRVDDEYYISEINPRFGGGYLLAYEAMEKFPEFILNNLKGKENAPNIGKYEENIYMMKHDDLLIKKELI